MESLTIENFIIAVKAFALIAYNFWPCLILIALFFAKEWYEDNITSKYGDSDEKR